MPEGNTKPRVSFKLILVVLPVLLLSLLLLTLLNYFSDTELKPTPDKNKSTISLDNSSEINPNKEYNNPFDKDTQYINPFSEYRNPFDQ